VPATESGDERGNEGFEREALEPVEAWNVLRKLEDVVYWQVSHRAGALLLARWVDGTLRHDAVHEEGRLLTMLFRELWLPTRVPREGRNR
jgi:hypothetical protein